MTRILLPVLTLTILVFAARSNAAVAIVKRGALISVSVSR